MRISARSDYACRALLELTLRWPTNEPLSISTISKRQKIPMRYLVQILIQLKRLGFVNSIRGKDGGYNLSKAPEEISLAEVMRGVGGSFLPIASSCEDEKSVFAPIWSEVKGAIATVLDRVTFKDIREKVETKKKTIIYQI